MIDQTAVSTNSVAEDLQDKLMIQFPVYLELAKTEDDTPTYTVSVPARVELGKNPVAMPFTMTRNDALDTYNGVINYTIEAKWTRL